MKKILALLMAGTLTVCLGACSGGSDKSEPDAEETAVSDEEEIEAEEETEVSPEAAEPGETVSTDKITIEVEESEAEDETAGQEAAESADAPDIANAVDGIVTTEYEPVPLGSWAKIELYATQDSTYHTVYVRVVKVTSQSKDAAYVNSVIDAHNAYSEEENRFDPADQDIPDDGELVVLDYEVYVPADFPAANYGMPEPKIYFSVRNIGGGGFPSRDSSEVYLGLGTTVDLAVREAGSSYYPGNTYGERCIYVMVQGYTDYEATYSSYPEGTTSDETSSDNMYTVYHSVN